MNVKVFWMRDPERQETESPFVRQPHYNDLENRIRTLEAALRRIADLDAVTGRELRIHAIASDALATSETPGIPAATPPIQGWPKQGATVQCACHMEDCLACYPLETGAEHTCPTCGTKFRGADDRFCPTCHAKAHAGSPLGDANG